MAKLLALKTILRRVEGVEELIQPRSVFDATPSEAKQLDALQSARPATKVEIAAAAKAQAKADGTAYAET
ncbi:hypothetical protein [Paracoccus sp. (in: a-proteobacteria)]|uniref:hypothetical protein n=1 Tax=Paracoccus sp. TaxID=267 RepID=UPI004058FDEB